MKEWVTEHTNECSSDDNSQVFWDPEDGISMCRECGGVSFDRDTDENKRMLQEGTNGHTP